MSIWRSVCGEDPVIYDGGYGTEVLADGFMDVAVSCWSERVRIIAEADGDRGCLSLDPDGVRELRRRLDEALAAMDAERVWSEHQRKAAAVIRGDMP